MLFRSAAIGTIKDQILPKEDVAAYVLHFLHQFYPDRLEERFGLENVDDMMEAFESIGKKRGCLESGGRINFEKVSDIILQDLRTGKLGMITLERPDS